MAYSVNTTDTNLADGTACDNKFEFDVATVTFAPDISSSPLSNNVEFSKDSTEKEPIQLKIQTPGYCPERPLSLSEFIDVFYKSNNIGQCSNICYPLIDVTNSTKRLLIPALCNAEKLNEIISQQNGDVWCDITLKSFGRSPWWQTIEYSTAMASAIAELKCQQIEFCEKVSHINWLTNVTCLASTGHVEDGSLPSLNDLVNYLEAWCGVLSIARQLGYVPKCPKNKVSLKNVCHPKSNENKCCNRDALFKDELWDIVPELCENIRNIQELGTTCCLDNLTFIHWDSNSEHCTDPEGVFPNRCCVELDKGRLAFLESEDAVAGNYQSVPSLAENPEKPRLDYLSTTANKLVVEVGEIKKEANARVTELEHWLVEAEKTTVSDGYKAALAYLITRHKEVVAVADVFLFDIFPGNNDGALRVKITELTAKLDDIEDNAAAVEAAVATAVADVAKAEKNLEKKEKDSAEATGPVAKAAAEEAVANAVVVLKNKREILAAKRQAIEEENNEVKKDLRVINRNTLTLNTQYEAVFTKVAEADAEEQRLRQPGVNFALWLDPNSSMKDSTGSYTTKINCEELPCVTGDHINITGYKHVSGLLKLIQLGVVDWDEIVDADHGCGNAQLEAGGRKMPAHTEEERENMVEHCVNAEWFECIEQSKKNNDIKFLLKLSTMKFGSNDQFKELLCVNSFKNSDDSSYNYSQTLSEFFKPQCENNNRIVNNSKYYNPCKRMNVKKNIIKSNNELKKSLLRLCGCSLTKDELLTTISDYIVRDSGSCQTNNIVNAKFNINYCRENNGIENVVMYDANVNIDLGIYVSLASCCKDKESVEKVLKYIFNTPNDDVLGKVAESLLVELRSSHPDCYENKNSVTKYGRLVYKNVLNDKKIFSSTKFMECFKPSSPCLAVLKDTRIQPPCNSC